MDQITDPQFPVYSTSTITPPCERFAERVSQRSSVAPLITHAGVFNCRKIHNSPSWSQHAYGNAGDFFSEPEHLQRIAHNFVMQAIRETRANRGDLVPIEHLIWKQGANGIWTPERGWHEYDGYHPATHVHVDFNPQGVGTPACAK